MNVPPKGNLAFRLGAYFETLKVSQQPVPNLTVRIAEGAFWAGGTTLVEFAGGNTAVMVPPGAGLAVWVLVALTANGSVQLVYGVPAATSSPPAPGVPAGYIPLAFVYLTNGMTAVTNDMIFDERPLWVMQTSFVPLAGATMTGPLILNANPTAALGAATKQYVDTQDALHPTFTDMNNGLLTKADVAGTPSDTFVLNSDWVGAPSTNVFFGVDRGSQPNTYIRWNEGTDVWELTNDGTSYSPIANTSALGAYLPLAGGTMLGALTLAADPAAPLQAATKQYTDAQIIAVGNATYVAKAGSTMTGVLVHPAGTAANPTVVFGADVTTGFYAAAAGEVDVAISGVKKVSFTSAGVTVFSGFFTPGTGGAAAPEHSFTNDVTTGLYRAGAGQIGLSAAGVNAATFSATGLAVAGNISATGGLSVTGPATVALDMGGFKVTNMGTPTVGTDATTKTYVDAAIAGIGVTYVDVTGDTMTGSLIMSGAGVQVVLPNAPTLGTHAANKTYVDTKVGKTDTFALTGDVTVAPAALTGPANSFAATLANTAVTAGSYGSASAVGTFTVDAKGRLTAAATVPVAILAAAVTNFSTAADARIAAAVGVTVEAWSAELDGVAALAGTGLVAHVGPGTYTERSLTSSGSTLTITNANGVSGNPNIDMPNVGTAGTYGSASSVAVVTTDAQGRVSGAVSTAIAITGAAVTVGGFTLGHVVTLDAAGHPVDSGIASANVFLADGSVLATGVFNMNSHKITNVSSGTTSGDALQFGQIGAQVQAWDADLDALAALSTTGIVARTGAATYSPRTITGTAGDISVTNGDGVAGNPTIDLINAGTAGTYDRVTTDAKGRVTSGVTQFFKGTQAVTFGAIATNDTGDSTNTITVTGAVVGDIVSVGLPATVPAGFTYIAWVSVANTVMVRAHGSASSSAAAGAANATIQVVVTSYANV